MKIQFTQCIAVDVTVGRTAKRRLGQVYVIYQPGDILKVHHPQRVAVNVAGVTTGILTTAVLAGITAPVAVGVFLARVVNRRAIVTAVGDTVTVCVHMVVEAGTYVTGVSDTVSIGINLVGIVNERTVVAGRAESVAVGVFQALVGNAIAVIVDPVADLGRTGVNIGIGIVTVGRIKHIAGAGITGYHFDRKVAVVVPIYITIPYRVRVYVGICIVM